MKSKFILDDEDFNRMLEIIANPKPVAQLIEGRLKWRTNQERVNTFWKSLACKYGYYPDTLEFNINPEDPREFVADSTKNSSDVFCALCDKITGPDHHSGCDRSGENGCAWYSDIMPSGKRDIEEDGYTDAIEDAANFFKEEGLVLKRGNNTINNPEYFFNELLNKNGVKKILVFSSGKYTYIE